VAANGTVRQDFKLASGHLVVTPTSITKTQVLGQTSTATLQFKNDGTGPAHVKLTERGGSFQILHLTGAKRINVSLEEEDLATPAFLGNHEHGDVPGVDAGAPKDPTWSQIASYPTGIMDNGADFIDGNEYSVGGIDTSFTLLNKGVGVRIVEATAAATGIVVGSHIPGQTVTIPDAGAFPIGTLIYAYPYHTTNTTARDVCQNATLTTVAPAPLLTRYGPTGGVDATYTCDQTASAGFPLRLGEGIQVSGENNGPKVFTPSHF
jgi:hypothetical protein